MIRDYVALDLETTGLSPRKDSILEIGAVRVKDGKVQEDYAELIYPGFPIPERITELTGITDEMVKNQRDERTVVEEFLEFCKDSVVVGHNIAFDLGFLCQKAVNIGKKFENEALDTLKIARKYLPELPSRKLGDLCVYYQIEQKQWHRAYEDARVTSELYRKLAADFYREGDAEFEPGKISYKVRKDAPATKTQKVYLNDLMKYHKIEMNVALDSLTRSQASRMVDGIIFRYGKMKR